MKHSLAEGYPFVFSVTLFNKSFDVAKKRGYVPMPDFDAEKIRDAHGRHAMLCVGYKESAKVFIVRNSWGETWGDKVSWALSLVFNCNTFRSTCLRSGI